MDIRIVVLQRGWVAVGDFRQVGELCELANPSIVRIWGTTKGLGEIATAGPTPKTVLDPCPRIMFHILTVVLALDCAEDKWAPHCKPR